MRAMYKDFEMFLCFFRFCIAVFPVSFFVLFIIDTLLWVRGIELSSSMHSFIRIYAGCCASFWMGVLYNKVRGGER